MKVKERRTTRLIEPYRQLKFGIVFLLLNLVFSLLIMSIFGFFMWDIFTTIQIYFELSDAQSLMTLNKFLLPASLSLGLIFIFILATLYCSVYFTHRIYGPLVSIRRFVNELTKNTDHVHKIHVRKHDELQDLIQSLNELAGKLNEKKNNTPI
jgi:signal transduction histidine kinase